MPGKPLQHIETGLDARQIEQWRRMEQQAQGQQAQEQQAALAKRSIWGRILNRSGEAPTAKCTDIWQRVLGLKTNAKPAKPTKPSAVWRKALQRK